MLYSFAFLCQITTLHSTVFEKNCFYFFCRQLTQQIVSNEVLTAEYLAWSIKLCCTIACFHTTFWKERHEPVFHFFPELCVVFLQTQTQTGVQEKDKGKNILKQPNYYVGLAIFRTWLTWSTSKTPCTPTTDLFPTTCSPGLLLSPKKSTVSFSDWVFIDFCIKYNAQKWMAKFIGDRLRWNLIHNSRK